jgi:hypothetical protein
VHKQELMETMMPQNEGHGVLLVADLEKPSATSYTLMDEEGEPHCAIEFESGERRCV